MFSIILLVITLPLLLVTAVAIKLNSKGPVIFRQARVGRNQELFTCYKFRSMYDGVSQETHQNYVCHLIAGTLEKGKDQMVYKASGDPRITSVGRFIRRLSIDELPQLINVIKGQMSLVGPRPVVHYEVQYYDKEMLERFSIKPGITGLWQVSCRSTLNYKEMIDLDILYIKRWSFLLDLKIILKTVFVVLKSF